MPEELVPRFLQALHDREDGWEELIHPDAEFTLTAFAGRTIRGREAIVRALTTGRGRFYEPRVRFVERLDPAPCSSRAQPATHSPAEAAHTAASSG